MLFVHKKTLEPLSALADFERQILHDPSSVSPQATGMLSRKLQSYKKTHWLQCDCGSPEAFIVICQKKGRIYLRCRTVSEHKSSCFFANRNVQLHLREGLGILQKKMKTFALYSELEQLSGDHPEEKEGTSQNISRLGQALYTLLTDADLTRLVAAEIQERERAGPQPQIDRLFEACRGKPIAPNLSLQNFFFRYFTDKSIETAKWLLRSGSPHRGLWPAALKPFCLFARVCRGVGGHSIFPYKPPLQFEQGKVPLQNLVTLPSPWISYGKSGPYLVLFSVLKDSKGGILYKDAFAMPVHSEKLLMPVESSYERQILKLIISSLSDLKAGSVSIEKPLFGMKTPKGECYRPDFLLHGERGQKIFIEVLGSTDPSYLDKKEHIRRIAERECDAYLSVRGGSSYSDLLLFEQQLITALRAYLL